MRNLGSSRLRQLAARRLTTWCNNFRSRVRAYRLRTGLVQDPVTADEPFEPDSNELAEPAQSTSVDEKGQPNSDDEVVAIALKAAIARCAKLLESLDHLVATAEPGVVPTTPKAPDEKSDGSA